jgi:hypothetical protein
VPADEAAQDELAKVKVGTSVLVEYVRARNPQQHKLMFAILNRMFENQRTGRYPTFEGFYTAVKYGLGWWDATPVKGGTIPVLWSLQFSQMPQDKFELLLEQVLALAERVGIPTADLRDENVA